MEKIIKTPAGFIVAFDRTLAMICGGDALCGLYLSQHNYWSTTESNDDGWICKTSHDWSSRIMITEDVQRRVRKKLVELAFIEEKNRGLPQKRHSRLIVENIQEAVDRVWGTSPDNNPEMTRTNSWEIQGIVPGNDQDYLKKDLKRDLKKDLKTPYMSPDGDDTNLGMGKRPKEKRATKVMEAESAAFAGWYERYPRREGRIAAWRAWQKQGCAAHADALMSVLDSHPALKREREFIPLPGTFLNQRRWEDDIPVALPDDIRRALASRDGWADEVIRGQLSVEDYELMCQRQLEDMPELADYLS